MATLNIIPGKSRRKLRERKTHKLYSDEYALPDEFEGGRGFSVAEKLESPKFAQLGMVREMMGSDLTIAFFQQYGFNIPLLIKEKTGTGLQVPSENFTIGDVRSCVGSKRVLDVMEVNTQKNLQMTMKEWQEYYEDPKKKKLLNVISLEFSQTKLENYVQSPSIVRQLDWIDVVWPKQLKEAQTEGTNSLTHMKYPKVQKYCLMSVKNCYTDFHIDFGGTSVWYHILKGSKVFWLIPPTDKNLQLYEKWVLSGKQSAVFFGDTVEKCARVYLTAGNTFMIPTGWIHAVYTPTDTLVFGGNFLHSFGIVKQLKCAQLEDLTKVPLKFRYPFFTEILWYTLSKYVYVLLGKSHLEGEPDRNEDIKNAPHVHLTHYELYGLKEIVLYLYALPPQKKNVPILVKDPVALIKDVRTLVEYHCKDNPQLAITGIPVLKPELNTYVRQYDYANNQININTDNVEEMGEQTNVVEKEDSLVGFISPGSQTSNKCGSRGPYKKHNQVSHQNGTALEGNKSNFGPRRRRTRCKTCEACQRSDCGTCTFCLDMIKFGGPGRAKQTCMMRQCLKPMLPVTAQCMHCHLDGWYQQPVPAPQVKFAEGKPSSLMECSVCYEISHEECAQKLVSSGLQGIKNEDLPNSWECPLCCESGKNADYKPRHFRARQKSSDVARRVSDGNEEQVSHAEKSQISIDTSNLNEQQKLHVKCGGGTVSSGSSENELYSHNKNASLNSLAINESSIKFEIKTDPDYCDDKMNVASVKRMRSDDDIDLHSENSKADGSLPRKKSTLRNQLAQQIMNSSTKQLKKPLYPVRPAQQSSQSACQNVPYSLDPSCLLQIFKYLPQESLTNCALVCKTWSNVSVDPSLWTKMNCSQYKLSAMLLMGIVRRQPETLVLDWTPLAKRQLSWIISRIPALKNLSLQGVPIQSIFGLHTCLCPPLYSLDLSFVRGLNDQAIREILLPPKDSRPGTDSKSRLRNLRVLKVAGTDISDVALHYITQGLPYLVQLDLSSCQRITDVGVAQIACGSAVKNLYELDLSSCKMITEVSLDYLRQLSNLSRLDVRHVPQISTQSVIKFAAQSKNNLQVQDIKLVDKRKA